MNEQNYERLVTDLERRYAATIAREAAHAVRNADDEGGYGCEPRRDAACEHVASVLLNDEAWSAVEAADISDIAYEAANIAADAYYAEVRR